MTIMNIWLSIIASIILTVIFSVLDDQCTRFSMSSIATHRIRNYLSLFSKLLIICLYLGGLIYIWTGNNVIHDISIAFTFAIAFGFGMQMVWELISPFKTPDLKQLSKYIEREDVRGLKLPSKGRFIAVLIFVILLGALPLILQNAQPLVQAAIYIVIILFLIFYSFFYYLILIFFISKESIDEEARMTALFKQFLEQYPVFMLLGTISNIWRVSGPASQSYTIIPVAWTIILILLSVVVINQLLEYQKGVARSRKLRDDILLKCIKELDRLEGNLVKINSRNWRFQMENIFLPIDKTIINIDVFSPKHIYDPRPANIFIQLIHQLKKASAQLARDQYKDYIQEVRSSLEDERKSLKESRPLVYDWAISGVSIVFSTLLAKIAESVAGFIK
jgi:hypothetical protein